jgi:hypothetical protein
LLAHRVMNGLIFLVPSTICTLKMTAPRVPKALASTRR